MILVEKQAEGYAVLTLNRPDALNALSSALRAQFAQAVRELEADPDVRVLILTGAGRGFCAGLDLKELATPGTVVPTGEGKGDPVEALRAFSGPVIGAINGVAITGGFELALACDVLIVSEEARFADTHARVGVMPGWGLSQKLSRAIGIYRAKELSLTGNFLSAQQAEAWGLVNRVVPADQLPPQARQMALDMLSVLPEMLVNYKKLIDDGFAASFGDGMKLELTLAEASNSALDPAEMEARRQRVRARGQAQTAA